MTDNEQPEAARWVHWRPQFRSGEETKRIRAWYRNAPCPRCDAPVGRACRTAAGHPTERHCARSDAELHHAAAALAQGALGGAVPCDGHWCRW